MPSPHLINATAKAAVHELVRDSPVGVMTVDPSGCARTAAKNVKRHMLPDHTQKPTSGRSSHIRTTDNATADATSPVMLEARHRSFANRFSAYQKIGFAHHCGPQTTAQSG